MKPSRVDRILDLLDQATQYTPEPSYAIDDHDRCWRCWGEPGEGSSGVCDNCRTHLLAEIEPPQLYIEDPAIYIDTTGAEQYLAASLRLQRYRDLYNEARRQFLAGEIDVTLGEAGQWAATYTTPTGFTIQVEP